MRNMNKLEVFTAVLFLLSVVVKARAATPPSTNITTATTIPPPPPPPAPKPCSTLASCETCLNNVSCLWCQSNSSCSDYPVSYVIPPASICKLSQARWGVCWMNFEALIIAMAVVLGTLLLGVTICCCCCCCCKRSRSSSFDRDDEQFSRRREEIRQRADERRADRKTKHDEIRKKYGLIPDSDHPYSKFENE